MCTPFLVDLKSRLVQLLEFTRSTRLKIHEVREQDVVLEQREPLFFTVNRVTGQILSQVRDIETASMEAALWNSSTSKDVISEFQTALANCAKEIEEIVDEAVCLRAEASELAGAVELLPPSAEFDELLTFVSRNEIVSESDVLALASRQIAQYQSDPEIRTSVFEKIKAFRKMRGQLGRG